MLWHCWVDVRKGIEWWGVDVVISLQWGVVVVVVDLRRYCASEISSVIIVSTVSWAKTSLPLNPFTRGSSVFEGLARLPNALTLTDHATWDIGSNRPHIIRTACRRCDLTVNAFVTYGLFLPRDGTLARYMLSSCVRLSVCLSVTSRYCVKTAKHGITQTTPHDRTGNLVFWCHRYPRNSTGVPNADGVG